MIKLGKILMLATTLCIFACEEPVELGLPQEEAKLGIISEFAPDRPFEVTVTNSISSISSAPIGFLVNATVTIFEGEKEFELLQLTRSDDDETPPYFFSRSKASSTMNEEYHIAVEAPGYPTARASDIIPDQTPIDVFEVENFQKRSEQAGYDLEVDFQFTPLPEHNYYHLILYYERISAFPNPPTGEILISQLDALPLDNVDGNPLYQNHFLRGILLKASDFNAATAKIALKTTVYPGQAFQVDQNVIAELRTVSEDYYRFHSTFTRHLSQQDSIVGQAIVLHNNIENGLGTFAAYNYVQDTISLE